jgi:tetratricopeptide (TPR) repeat protein/cephalosporin hydroxylase
MELTIEQALQQGVAAHKAGKLEEAERLYRAILQSQPLHPDANHNLGVIAVSVNKPDVALPLFKTALEANPKIEQFWLSYIEALIKEKQFDNAKAVLEQAKQQGLDADRLNSLEAQLSPKTQIENVNSASPSQQKLDSLLEYYQNERFSEAEKLAVEINQEFPKHQLAWKVLGAVLGATGRKSEAVDANQTVVALSPQDAEAHSNLGNTLKELGRLDEALASYTQAIALKPDFAEAQSNLGVTLQELGRLEEAEASYMQAIVLKPGFATAHNNLGITLHERGDLVEAEASYTQAIALKPDYAEAHNNLGATLEELGRLDDAEASYRKAIDNNATMGEAYLGLSSILRQCGNLEESSNIQIKGLELTSAKIVSNSSLKTVIPKFVKKMQQQNGIPTFFDNYVFSHLRNKPNLSADICGIFEDGQSSKDNRFVSFSERVKAIPGSMPSGRLFDGIPFASSQGIHSLIKWKEHSLYKTSSDLVLYWMILQDVKPDVIIELGSGDGGSAIWLADMAHALGLDTHVYSYDINKPKLNHPRVTFIEYDLMKINQQSKPPCWEFFLGGKLLIEDAHVNLKNVLDLFDNILSKDDYLIVEDSDAKQEIIRDFAGEKEPKYKLDQFFLDFFGTNITCSKNSIFKVS